MINNYIKKYKLNNQKKNKSYYLFNNLININIFF